MVGCSAKRETLTEKQKWSKNGKLIKWKIIKKSS